MGIGSSSIADRLMLYVRTMLSDHTPVVLLAAALGFAALARRSASGFAFLALSFVIAGGFGANFQGNERQFTYYLPSFVALIYACAEGLTAIWRLIAARLERRPEWLFGAQAVGLAGLALVALAQFGQAYPIRRAEALYGEPLDIWRQTLKTGNMSERLAAGMSDLPLNAVVIGDWEQLTVLWYYQKVEHRRPDLTILYPIDRLADYAAGDDEIVLARHMPVGAEWHPTNVGALVRLQRQPGFAVPDHITPVGAALYTEDNQPRLELVGHAAESDVYAAGRYAPLLITWRALTNIAEDYSISLHILDENWQQLWSQDIAAPVLGMYPTSRWVKDEIVQDYHELAIPREMPPGRYLWTVVVYRQAADGSFVQLRDAQGNIDILGGTFEVVPR
jgi:hypothetical protein